MENLEQKIKKQDLEYRISFTETAKLSRHPATLYSIADLHEHRK